MSKTLHLLERLGNLLQQELRDDANALGLQPVHVQIMAYLRRANRYSDMPIAVAEYLGLTRGTVSQSIKLLEQKGLLQKHSTHPQARKQHLQLTAAGTALLDTSNWHGLQALLEEDALETNRQEQMLQALLTKLQQARDGKPFGVCHDCVFHQRSVAGARCGLTGEALQDAETQLLCREWQAA